MTLYEYLTRYVYIHMDEFIRRTSVFTKDGFNMSVQASSGHYSRPKISRRDASEYTAFEVGYPSEMEEMLEEYRDGDSQIYGFVPVNVLEAIIEKHGGLDLERGELEYQKMEKLVRK